MHAVYLDPGNLFVTIEKSMFAVAYELTAEFVHFFVEKTRKELLSTTIATMLRDYLPSSVEENDMDDVWFKQDGDTCHTASIETNLSRTVFENRIINRNGDVKRLPRRNALTLLNYSFFVRSR